MSFRLAPKRVIAEQQADRGRTPVSFRLAPKLLVSLAHRFACRTSVSFRPAPKRRRSASILSDVGDLCHFDRLRNPLFRGIVVIRSETYVISTGSETDGLVFGLSPGPSRFETARKRASRFIDPAHRCVLHGLHALEFRRPPPYISLILAFLGATRPTSPAFRREGSEGKGFYSPAVLASIHFSPFRPTHFHQSRHRCFADRATADAPLPASPCPPSRRRPRETRPSGGRTARLSL